tara:strand:- start:293 stop:514 length:222 start_codon:yes stop_codon:yes gene_type:complete
LAFAIRDEIKVKGENMSNFYLKVSVTKDGEFVVNAKTEEEALERLKSGGEMNLVEMWSEPTITVNNIREVPGE